MKTSSDSNTASLRLEPTDIPESTADNGTRSISVVVPNTAYWHAKSMASHSRMSFKDFIGHVLATAEPYTKPDKHEVSSPILRSNSASSPIQAGGQATPDVSIEDLEGANDVSS